MLGKPLREIENLSELDRSFAVCYEPLGLPICELEELWKQK